MPFKVAARTILQLGAELISSDAVAFYELIKNAFDAGSPDVEIEVVIRIPSGPYGELHRVLREECDGHIERKDKLDTVKRWRRLLTESIDATAPNAIALRESLEEANTFPALMEALEEANYIEINDTGSGMSLTDLTTVYLTVGTPYRQQQKEAQRNRWSGAGKRKANERPVLGEKGIGRLAVMRLGLRLHVRTATIEDSRWNLLRVNWNDFKRDPDKPLEEVSVKPGVGALKKDPKDHGTSIRISALTSAWTKDRLRQIAGEDISKMSDPFTDTRFPVQLAFNAQGLSVPRLDRMLFEHAQAHCNAVFSIHGNESRLDGKIHYTLREKSRAFTVDGENLLSATGAESFAAINALGPFAVRFYWFNRQTLRKLEGVGNLQEVIRLQDQWAGGIMVYRDGFRVNPYGSGDDDWLTLDPIALGSPGYKVNRRQIVGKVDISSAENPALVDQTNREGLRDCPEKLVLIKLLQHMLLDEFKPFLEQCDADAARPPLTARQIDKRVGREEKRMRQSLKLLKREYPQIEQDTQIVGTIQDSIARIRTLMEQARDQVSAYKKTRDKVVHLAATGLLVEILAHELNRATRHSLIALQDLRKRDASSIALPYLSTLESQLKTLQKRLRMLDPLSQAGRQVKETFDLVEWIEEIVNSHHEQFRRHRITSEVTVVPSRVVKGMKVKMVKGMLVQVMENLLSNSVYWLKQRSRLEKDFNPRITVTINATDRTVSVSDNGPGVDPSRTEVVFEPYYTTKPAGEGKGLGLFISREIAKYHKSKLSMSDQRTVHPDRLNTFVLSLGDIASD